MSYINWLLVSFSTVIEVFFKGHFTSNMFFIQTCCSHWQQRIVKLPSRDLWQGTDRNGTDNMSLSQIGSAEAPLWLIVLPMLALFKKIQVYKLSSIDYLVSYEN